MAPSLLSHQLPLFLLGPEMRAQMSGARGIQSETSNEETVKPDGDRLDDEDWGSLEVKDGYSNYVKSLVFFQCLTFYSVKSYLTREY